MKRINDLVLTDISPKWLEGKGILATLTSNHPVPWKSTISDGSILDLEYYGNRSGNKIIAPVLYNLITAQDEGLSDANMARIASLIWLKYGLNWTELWDTLSYEYNPINNYDMEESETGSNSNTRTLGTSSNTNIKGSTRNKNDIYGFNSVDPVPASESTTTFEGDGQDTLTTDSGTIKDNGTNSRTFSRHGNIGIMSTQDLIGQQRELWTWQFFDQVYSDIDEMITIPSFGDGQPDWIELVKEHSSVYVLPVATPTTLGGVKPVAKSASMTREVGIDADGKLWTIAGGEAGGAVDSVNGKTGAVVLTAEDVGALPEDTHIFSGDYNDLTNKPTIPEPYTLPVASSTDLGGVKAIPKQTEMTSEVGIDSDGKLWSVPGGGSGGGAVESVNGKTGAVVLTAAEVGALPDTTPLFSGNYSDLSGKPDLTEYQTVNDSNLDTTSKTITGAINEVFSKTNRNIVESTRTSKNIATGTAETCAVFESNKLNVNDVVLINGLAQFAQNATGYRRVMLSLNSSGTTIRTLSTSPAVNGNVTVINFCSIFVVSQQMKDEGLALRMEHNAGATLNNCQMVQCRIVKLN